ncbi:MAG: hypothetical protein ACXWMX_00900 [Candidatus Limnocylindrales bacterium]
MAGQGLHVGVGLGVQAGVVARLFGGSDRAGQAPGLCEVAQAVSSWMAAAAKALG